MAGSGNGGNVGSGGRGGNLGLSDRSDRGVDGTDEICMVSIAITTITNERYVPFVSVTISLLLLFSRMPNNETIIK